MSKQYIKDGLKHERYIDFEQAGIAKKLIRVNEKTIHKEAPDYQLKDGEIAVERWDCLAIGQL